MQRLVAVSELCFFLPLPQQHPAGSFRKGHAASFLMRDIFSYSLLNFCLEWTGAVVDKPDNQKAWHCCHHNPKCWGQQLTDWGRPAGPTADLEKGPAPDRTQLQNPAVLLCPDVSKIKKPNPNQAALLSLGLAKALRAD